jgi:F0F1-type ATP synthase membrane subunit b/b'
MNYTLIAEYSQIASAVLFLIAMIWIWIKFIQPAVLVAQQNQNAQLAEAERHRDEAKAALDALQGEIEKAQGDAEAIRLRVQAQAQAERDAILRESREAGERAVRNAGGELSRSRAAAREQLREEIADRVLNLARVEASQRVDAATDRKLVLAFLSDLERGGVK